MSFEQAPEVYPETNSSALITPPKDPSEKLRDADRVVAVAVPSLRPRGKELKPFSCTKGEQSSVAAKSTTQTCPRGKVLLKPSSCAKGEFSPIKPASACKVDLEPLPFRGDDYAFGDSFRSDDILQPLRFSLSQDDSDPLNLTGTEDEDENGSGGEEEEPQGVELPPLPVINEANPDTPDEQLEPAKLPRKKVKFSELQPVHYPRSQWPAYPPPPPHYWYPHYHHYPYPYDPRELQTSQRRQPILYPKLQKRGYHHPYPPSPYAYGPNGEPYPMAVSPHQVEYITDVTDYDVICGRGGAVNAHPGNKRFRGFIAEFKHKYMSETKQMKPYVAMEVLDAVRSSDPPGRFLVKYPHGYVICNEERAREKASQALREGAAKLRKEESLEADKDANAVKRKRGRPRKVMLHNEIVPSQSYMDDPDYADFFDPPKKKQNEARAPSKNEEI